MKKVETHEALFEALRHPSMPVQVSMLLLRHCAHPRMNYVCRSMPPSITAEACRRFDQMVLETAVAKLQLGPILSLPLEAQKQLQLPLRLGGFGLRSTEATAPAAFLGSVSAASAFLSAFPNPFLDDIKHCYHLLSIPNAGSISMPIPNARRQRQDQPTVITFPPPHLFTHQFRTRDFAKLQKVLSHRQDNQLLVSLTSQVRDPAVCAHLISRPHPPRIHPQRLSIQALLQTPPQPPSAPNPPPAMCLWSCSPRSNHPLPFMSPPKETKRHGRTRPNPKLS